MTQRPSSIRWGRLLGPAGAGPRVRPLKTSLGLPVIPYEPDWASFSLGRDTRAVQVSGRIEGSVPGNEKSVIVRLKVFDAAGADLTGQLRGTRMSPEAGKYFYPLEYLQGDAFRFAFPAPKGAARIEAALQHWRKIDKTLYGYTGLSAAAVHAAVNPPAKLTAAGPAVAIARLGAAEEAVRSALRQYAEQIAAVPGPLYEDEAPFGEPLAEYIIHDEQLSALASRLAGRRLRAGRDLDALGLAGLADEPELDKAVGMRRLDGFLDSHSAGEPSPVRSRTLVYLMHNALPYDSGGYAARSHGLLRAYVEAGWTVHAFTRPGYPQDRGHDRGADVSERDGVRYHTLTSHIPFDHTDQTAYVRDFADQVVSACAGLNVGVVQAASFFRNGMAGRLAADRLGAPFVYEMRGMEWLTRASADPRWAESDQCRLMRDLELSVARSADHVFAITTALQDWLIENAVPANKVSVLANGCSADAWRPVERNAAMAAKLGLKGGAVVAYIGSFSAYEGIPDIIDAVMRARAMAKADIRLMLVGDGQMSSEIDQHIAQAGAASFVVRTGRVPHDQIPDYYSVADMLVMARRETPLTRMISPLKPLEALALGRRVISTDVSGVAEPLKAAGVGRLTPANGAFGLAQAIAEYADAPATERASEEARGRAWVAENRDWSVLVGAALKVMSDRFGGAAFDAPSARPGRARAAKKRAAGA